MTEKKTYPTFSYDAHARTCAPDDFLGQVRRTLNGVPISDDQLAMIKHAVAAGLALKSDDVLLELACGNGALSRSLFEVCKSYMGIDISNYLISVAKQNFERLPDYQFAAQGALTYVLEEAAAERFSKALCYAGFQYFSDNDAAEILRALYARFINLERIFIGNLPDKALASEFYRDRMPSTLELVDSATAIGVWRTRAEFAELAEDTGWKVAFSTMPPTFHSAYYRYDVVLSR